MSSILDKSNLKSVTPFALILFVLGFYLFSYDTYSVLNNRQSEVFWWMRSSWVDRNFLEHGLLVPVVFIALLFFASKSAKDEPESKGGVGGIMMIFGMLLFLISARTIQPRIALVGIPFVLSGLAIYVLGFKRGKHFIFASFFWYFAIPIPGLIQVTNNLQVLITKSCFWLGEAVGMDIINSGNTIKSATNSWHTDIAEGCSGMKSLYALLMIAALYANFTQKLMWKKIVIFLSSIPLAIAGNFFRIFSIMLISEAGYSELALNTYHDWSGLVLFFPVALGGMFLLDKLLNRKKRRVVRSVISSEANDNV